MQSKNSSESIEKFLEYSAELSSKLIERDDVIGLVFVGSAAETSRVDEWSDHDFFVVTKNGLAEGFRQDLTWLPRHEEIAISPRETEHGLKVVYLNGQVLEFAIFNDAELELVTVNSYSVAFDKTNIAEQMAAIASTPRSHQFNADIEFQLFLAQILIGVGRARRGELLSAGQFINSFAVNHALGLIRSWLVPVAGRESDEDDLNRFRRVEFQYPEISRALNIIQQMDVEPAAKELLRTIKLHGGDRLSERQQSQIKVITDRLDWEL